jgi:predicted nucleotidyltransferase component of viral defense system
MLARSELAGIARRDGVPLGIVERDYVQHLLLRHLARAPLAFKGGTCLRIAHGSARYSEDLDFDAEGEAEGVAAQLREAADRLGDYGIPAEIVRRPAIGVEAVVRYEGPLFDGSPRSRGSVRVDVSLRGERVEVEEVFVPRTPYADMPQLVVRALTMEHLFAEKVRAVLVRGQARDLYDVQFLLARGATCGRDLLDAKMGLYRRRYSQKALDKGMWRAAKAWSRDLEPLLGQVPPLAGIEARVREALLQMTRRGA